MDGSPSEKFLFEKYKVKICPIAGCIVFNGIIGGAEGYNATMMDLLNEKYDKDIFEEANKKENPAP